MKSGRVTRGRQRRWWALGAVSLTVLAVTVDGTVLSVALPTLAGALHASESDLEWFSSGYLMVLAAAVLPAGLIGDRFGRKRLLAVCLAAFGAGSVLCAEAPGPGVFLAARLLMGLAGSGITVMAMSALTVLFDDADRPKAVGVYEAANFLGLPAGPVLGGWLLSHFWWGWVFLLNVPVAAIGLTAALILVPESRSPERHGLDPAGSALSATGLVALTYGLIQAGEDGWDAPAAWVLMAAGLAALTAFAVRERRLARQFRLARGGEPLIDPALFRSASFTWGAVLGGIAGLAMIGVLFVTPQYFQAVWGDSALGSGLRLLPLIGGLIAGALPASAVARGIGARLTVALGFAVLAAGALLGATTGTGSGTAFVAAWMAVLGAGTGLTLTAATAAALSRLSADRAGTGSAVVQAFQKTAGPLGTAVTGSVLAAAYQARLGSRPLAAAVAVAARQSVYDGVAAAGRAGSPGAARGIRAAFTSGMDAALLASAGLAVAGGLLAVAFFPRRTTTVSDANTDPVTGTATGVTTGTATGTTAGRPGLRERKKAMTRATIQGCAMRLFREQGYEATTIEQIIDAAGVSETTFFRYFPTKEDVVLDDDYDPRLIAAFHAQPPGLAPAPALRAAFAEAFAGMTAEQRAQQRELAVLALSVPRLRAAMLAQISQAMRVLSDAMAERAGRARDDFAVRTVAGAIVGAAVAVAAVITEDPDADLAALIDQAITRLEPGLAL